MNMDVAPLFERLGSSLPQIRQFCRRHHIQRLYFFGSVVRDDFRPDSDIDVLVEFEPGFAPGFDFFTMQLELSRQLGRSVDLQTIQFLSPSIRETVLGEAVLIYEQT